MDKKKNKLPTDGHLFQQAMDDVKPLKSPARTDSKAPRVPPKIGRHKNGLPASIPGIDSEDGVSYRQHGIQKRIMQKLKRGRFKLGDQLDLHHMNTKTGAAALLEFIAQSQAGSMECIRIIHGKGLRSEQGPKLKTMTRQLLREHPQVLAFTACKPADGGDGATDVLLKSC
jgi:DNA-nicking Smr family endonuclease